MKIDITNLKHFKDIGNLKIDTPDGFQDIGELYYKTKPCYSILFSNGEIIECSEDHLFQNNDEWIKTKDLKINQELNHRNGKVTVLDKIDIGIQDTYDLEVLHENHRYYSNDIVSHNSGKTILALSAAMKLLDSNTKYDKIVYIRKTIISDSEELGFLKGDLDEKMAGFLAPLFSNLSFIVDRKYKNKKTKFTQEEIDAKIEDLKNKYNIQFMYEGHLRGTNIRNAVVIWDETQNESLSSAKTILTRMSENCKVFAMGSIKQIDSKYVNAHNNALTYLINKIGQDNKQVNLTGYNLDKTVRSAIADWADDF